MPNNCPVQTSQCKIPNSLPFIPTIRLNGVEETSDSSLSSEPVPTRPVSLRNPANPSPSTLSPLSCSPESSGVNYLRSRGNTEYLNKRLGGGSVGDSDCYPSQSSGDESEDDGIRDELMFLNARQLSICDRGNHSVKPLQKHLAVGRQPHFRRHSWIWYVRVLFCSCPNKPLGRDW